VIRRLLAASLALAILHTPAALAEPKPSDVAVNARTVPLTISGTGHRVLKFRVEVARTPAQQELGLMYRRKMAADHGMIFPMTPPRFASFWMRNTYLPLDLIFVRADGTIASIAPDAKPLSLDTIDSFEPVAAVLELNAGVAARRGIKAGDRVRW